MKKSSLVIIAAGVIGIAATGLYIAPKVANYISKTNKGLPVKYDYRQIDRLSINSLEDYRTLVYKNKIDGLKDIKELVESAKGESWVYEEDKKRWIEIGEQSSSGGNIKNIGMLKELIRRYKNDNFEVYVLSPEYVIPGGREKVNLIILSNTAYKTGLEGNFKINLCSEYGICSASLTSKGKKEFRNTDYGDHISYIFGPFIAEAFIRGIFPFMLIKTDSEISIEKIKERCKKFNESANNQKRMKLEFESWDALLK